MSGPRHGSASRARARARAASRALPGDLAPRPQTRAPPAPPSGRPPLDVVTSLISPRGRVNSASPPWLLRRRRDRDPADGGTPERGASQGATCMNMSACASARSCRPPPPERRRASDAAPDVQWPVQREQRPSTTSPEVALGQRSGPRGRAPSHDQQRRGRRRTRRASPRRGCRRRDLDASGARAFLRPGSACNPRRRAHHVEARRAPRRRRRRPRGGRGTRSRATQPD